MEEFFIYNAFEFKFKILSIQMEKHLQFEDSAVW